MFFLTADQQLVRYTTFDGKHRNPAHAHKHKHLAHDTVVAVTTNFQTPLIYFSPVKRPRIVVILSGICNKTKGLVIQFCVMYPHDRLVIQQEGARLTVPFKWFHGMMILQIAKA